MRRIVKLNGEVDVSGSRQSRLFHISDISKMLWRGAFFIGHKIRDPMDGEAKRMSRPAVNNQRPQKCCVAAVCVALGQMAAKPGIITEGASLD